MNKPKGYKDGIEAVTLICPHCKNPSLQLVMGESTDEQQSYSLICTCGAKATVVEEWDLSKADPALRNNASVIGLL